MHLVAEDGSGDGGVCVRASKSVPWCICPSSQPTWLCSHIFLMLGNFGVDQVGGRKVCLLESFQKDEACRRWTEHVDWQRAQVTSKAYAKRGRCEGGLRQVQKSAGVDLGMGLQVWWVPKEVRTRVELGQTHAEGLMAAWLRTGPDASRYDTTGQGRSQEAGRLSSSRVVETGSRQVGAPVQLRL